MPTISMFYGIVIRMYREIGGKHNLPHIHAEYQNDEGVEVNENYNRFVYHIVNPDWRNSITDLSLQKRKQVAWFNPAGHNLLLFFIDNLLSGLD